MTAPRFRRHRSSDGRRPAFAGDFPGDDRDITEVIGRPADWDGSAIEWGGASDVGLPGGGAYPAAVSPAGDYRRAIAQANAGPATAPLAPLRAQPHAPDMFPALPPAPPAPAPPQPAPAGQHDTGPQQRLPRYSRTAARPRPRRDPDCAIFIWVPSVSQHVLLCGMCRWRRHADPVTATMPFTFESLRQSAYVTGWRLDAFTRWCCPHCQGTPAYRTPYGVTFWDMDAAAFRSPGSWPARHWIERERPVTEDHDSPYAAMHAGDPAAEFWITAEVEVDMLGRAADGVSHGRHAAVTR